MDIAKFKALRAKFTLRLPNLVKAAMALHELNVFATAARSIDEAVSSVYVDEKATEDSVGLPSLKQPDLAAVEWMRLHGNAISTLEQKLFAPNLTYLDVSSNDIRILDGALLTNLPKLAVLDVSSNQISNVIHVSGLTTLTSLRLACNALESLDWLFGFHSSRHRLQRLDVCGNMVSEERGWLIVCRVFDC
jgi:Leucine-rich repeat (LRR) protein